MHEDVLPHWNTMFENKFQFVDVFKTTFNTLSTTGKQIEFKANILGQEMVVISSQWYEPYRSQIRSGFLVLFDFGLLLSLFSLISSSFGLSVTKESPTTGSVSIGQNMHSVKDKSQGGKKR